MVARISELHYSNAYARRSGISEFLEVALGPSDDPADFTVGFYQADGSLGIEVALNDPRVVQSIDSENGEVIFVLSADNLPIFLTDPDGGGADNYEAYALTNTAEGQVLDFYDIGGGTQNIVAQSGAAAGATSENLPVVVGPDSTTTTMQFNQPNPDTLTYETASAGDTGIACFVAGTRIDTPNGPKLIETLQAGDVVHTFDNGPTTLRWIGLRTVSGLDDFAPICFKTGAYGVTDPVWVSPQHRVLVGGWRAQLYCGEDEVLIAAKALVDGRTVLRTPQSKVTYVHLLFDDHQIISSQGLLSESYFPAASETGGWDTPTTRELAMLFPEMAGRDFGETVRAVQSVRYGAVLRAA